MLRRSLLAFALLFVAGCRAPRAVTEPPTTGKKPPDLELTALALETKSDDRVMMTASLAVREGAGPGQVEEVRWELWLRGRWFASGVQSTGGWVRADAPSTISIEAPLVVNGVRVDPLTVEAGLRGQVVLVRSGGRTILRFASTKRIASPIDPPSISPEG